MLAKPESELVERLLYFANFEKIRFTHQVEAIFSGVEGLTGKLSPYDPKELRTAIAEQESLRETLTKIAERKSSARDEAIDITNARLRHVRAEMRLVNGRLTVVSGLLGVQACAWYAVALLLDQTRGLYKRFSRCRAPGCGKFLLSPSVRGRPVRHCSETHRRRADAIASRDRSDMRRQRIRAKKLLSAGETVDFVRGRCDKLTGEEVQRIAERMKARRR